MAELAPCVGITRIRFKGSAPKQFGALSATRLPRTFFLAQNKTDTSEVNDEQIAGRLLWTIYNRNGVVTRRLKASETP
jgi:hypothetical protein